MSSFRRLGIVLGILALITGVSAWQVMQAEAQVVIKKPGAPGSQPEEFRSALTLPKNRKAQQVMNACRSLIEEEDWGQVVGALQSLLNTPQDAFITVEREIPGGDRIPVKVSIRSEANRMLGSMPPNGLEFYEVKFGGEANTLLDQARRSKDPDIYADIARRFLHTEAGGEAITYLGTRCLDFCEPIHASLYFEKLLSRPGKENLPTYTLLKAAVAFDRGGQKDLAKDVWRMLENREFRDGAIRVNGRMATVANIRQEVENSLEEVPGFVRNWYVMRGSPNRTAQGRGGPPFMDPLWYTSTLPIDSTAKSWTSDMLKRASEYMASRNQAVLPSSFPVAVGDKVIYRAYDGVYAVSMEQEGKVQWYHQTDGGLQSMLSDASKRGYLENWKNTYLTQGPRSVLFDNSVVGTLSTDGQRVFLVDDMALMPHPYNMRNFRFQQPNFGALREAVTRNSLRCINLETGKFTWELSGRFNTVAELENSFFLGPPLPLGGKLYVLNEKNSELRLVCLEAKDDANQAQPQPPEIVWMQPLANVRDKYRFDLNRRIQVAQISYDDGILVCPTNAGAVVGVDLLTHSLVWAHSYREETNVMPPRNRGVPMPQIFNNWKVSAPGISKGKVVFTAPDASAIHCLSLRDGTQQWPQPVKRSTDDLYFAGIIDDKVLIVGKNYVRALHLANGKQAWRRDGTGVPTGQGVASDNVYYLPTKISNNPEVCSINVEDGSIVAHTRGKVTSGNLMFHNGEVISQSLDRITAYPQLAVKLSLIDERIKKNPNDPIGLIERGELRLDKGELPGAYADLHTALENNPPAKLIPKARLKLYRALTQLLNRDFDKYEQHLAEYKELCKSQDQAEQLRRQGNYLCLLGKGREQQGRLVDAFQAYMDFGALAGSQELISVSDEPNTKSRPDVWARGRIAAMIAKAAPEQRKPLDDKIAEKWRSIQSNSDLKELRAFVSVFGSTFESGREARLRLAEQLITKATDPKADDLRDAQLHLLRLRSDSAAQKKLTGRAVLTLARLMEKKQLMEHAAHYYRELGRDFANVEIEQGKTGADYFSEFTTDKRYLPYLDAFRISWLGKFKQPVEHRNGSNPIRQVFTLEPQSNLLPFFKRHRVVLDQQVSQIRIIDKATGKEHWRSKSLPGLAYLSNITNNPNFRHIYYAQGHVIVIQLGHWVYGFDPVDRKHLWEFNLYAPGTTNSPKVNQVLPANDGTLQIVYQDGWRQLLGLAGAVKSTYVCLHTRDSGLVALDPQTGGILWTKSDVSSRTRFFGDDRHVFLVDVNQDGTASSAARAVRASDGVTVNVPDFTEEYSKRIKEFGNQLLVRDQLAKGTVQLRLYDVLSGKNVWTRDFATGTKIVKCEDKRLAGAISPDGKLVVLDIPTRKAVLETNLYSEHKPRTRPSLVKADMTKLRDIRLLQDRDQFYLVLNQPDQANGNVWTSVRGFRCFVVNGTVVAYDRTTGKRNWANVIKNQMMVMEQFKSLPILFFTARTNQWAQRGVNRISTNVLVAKGIHKKSGKLMFDKVIHNNHNYFHAINANPREGVIEMVHYQFKLRLVLDKGNGQASAATPGGAGREVSQVTAPQPVPRAVPVRAILPQAVPAQIKRIQIEVPKRR